MVDESLERDVQAAFGEQWQAALKELNIYGREPYEREPERVRRAVLKLAEAI